MLKACVLALLIFGITVDQESRRINLFLDLGETYSVQQREFYLSIFCRMLAPPFWWRVYEVRISPERKWQPERVDWGAVEACEEVRG